MLIWREPSSRLRPPVSIAIDETSPLRGVSVITTLRSKSFSVAIGLFTVVCRDAVGWAGCCRVFVYVTEQFLSQPAPKIVQGVFEFLRMGLGRRLDS